MPDGLSQRVRFLFAAFVMLVAPLTALRLLDAGVALVPNGVATLATLLVVAVWAWRQYRNGGLPWWADLMPVVALFVAGWQLGDARSVFVLMFVVAFGRALYDGWVRVWANAAAYLLAYEAIVATTGGMAAVIDVTLVVTSLELVAGTGVMLLVGEVLRVHEQTARHEEVLARAASRLHRAQTDGAILEAVAEEALALVGTTPHTAVTAWRGDEQTIQLGHGAGEVAADTPPEVSLARLPDDVRSALLAREPFVADEETCGRVQRSVGMGGSYRSMLFAPLLRDDRFAGLLCVLSRSALPGGVAPGLDRLAIDASRAFGRVEAEQALSASERRFRSLAENVSEGMYRMTFQPEPRFEYVNPALEAITGFPAQAFLDDADLPLRQVNPDDRPVIERMRAGLDEFGWSAEVRWQRPTGEWVWHSVRESTVYGADGVPSGAMGIVSDITARKLQERAQRGALVRERDASEKLRNVDAMRTTFIQAISHELRTPLTAITGYSQTLHRNHDVLDRATQRRMLERLEANADTLDRLLADLLDVDRLSSHELEPVRREVDMMQLVHRVVAQVEGAADHVTCVGGTVLAQVEASKVERIVENLVRNARKHTGADTPIRITVGHDGTDHGAVLTVADEGPGIPAAMIDTIFDPFVQGPGSSSRATPGMGIGLSLVARFAEMHGGNAQVTNGANGGAVFRVWLPGQAPDQPPTAHDDTPRASLVRLRTARRRSTDQEAAHTEATQQPLTGQAGGADC